MSETKILKDTKEFRAFNSFGQTFTGTVVVLYGSGQKLLCAEYVNGLRHGKQERWYENGNKWEEYYCHRGLRHGSFNLWYYDGQKWIETNYEKDKIMGFYIEWHQNGNLQIRRLYEKRPPMDKNLYDNGIKAMDTKHE